GPYVFTFAGTLAPGDRAQTYVASNFAGMSTITNGAATFAEVQALNFGAAPTSGTFFLTDGTTTAPVTIPASPTAANVTTAIQTAVDSIWGAGNTTVAVPANIAGPYVITFIGTRFTGDQGQTSITTNVPGQATNTNGTATVAEIQQLTFPATPVAGQTF